MLVSSLVSLVMTDHLTPHSSTMPGNTLLTTTSPIMSSHPSRVTGTQLLQALSQPSFAKHVKSSVMISGRQVSPFYTTQGSWKQTLARGAATYAHCCGEPLSKEMASVLLMYGSREYNRRLLQTATGPLLCPSSEARVSSHLLTFLWPTSSYERRPATAR